MKYDFNFILAREKDCAGFIVFVYATLDDTSHSNIDPHIGAVTVKE